MDNLSDPYAPGAGTRPPMLAGRDGEFARYETLLGRAQQGRTNQSIMLTGLRGVGKTVLLRDFAERAQQRDWIVGEIEVRADAEDGYSFQHQVARALNSALRRASAGARVKGALKSALASFKAFSLKIDPSGSLALGIDIDPQTGRADTGNLEQDLSELAVDLATAASAQHVGVALMVDELQDLPKSTMSALAQACHEANRRALPFYVVGAGLPSIPSLLAGAKSYAERLFDYTEIGMLSEADASVAILRPSEAEGATWDATALQMVIDASGGYPYFLQELASATWRASATKHIGEQDAAIGLSVGMRKLEVGFFRSRWDRAAPSERSYMGAMAALSDTLAESGAVAGRLGKSTQQLAGVRSKLIAKGLVYAPDHGLVGFTVPRFAEFVERSRRR